MSRIAAPVQVPRQEDFGVDFIGALLRVEGTSIHEGAHFRVQVKSNATLLARAFGAFEHGRWAHHEVQWLLGRDPYPVHLTPLFVGVVDLQAGAIEFYSTINMFHARWMAGNPTEVVLVPGTLPAGPQAAPSFSVALPYPDKVLRESPPPGDGKRWLVRLREPIARLTATMVAGPDASLVAVRDTLNAWIRVEQLNRIAAFLRIPAGWYYEQWQTNVVPDERDLRPTVYGTSRTDADLPYMEDSLHPLLMALRYNYHLQGDVLGEGLIASASNFVGARFVGRHSGARSS